MHAQNSHIGDMRLLILRIFIKPKKTFLKIVPVTDLLYKRTHIRILLLLLLNRLPPDITGGQGLNGFQKL
jgi:hypothetical protein